MKDATVLPALKIGATRKAGKFKAAAITITRITKGQDSTKLLSLILRYQNLDEYLQSITKSPKQPDTNLTNIFSPYQWC